MRSATSPSLAAARLVPVSRRDGLPAWCDRHLDPPGSGSFFAGRLWYDTLIAHGLDEGSEPVLAACGPDEALLLPLLRTAHGRLRSLASPYSLDWRPLPAPGADAALIRSAGQDLGRHLLRVQPPVRLDTLDPEAPGLEALLQGLRRAGIVVLRYRHFGNWHDRLPPGCGWPDYLGMRPPALRSTIRRKLARCEREMRFDLLAAPGPALDAGIAAYEEVRARSWKPYEPHPGFDAALIRAAAGAGLLRLGVLRSRGDGRPVAAQYWVLDHTGARALLLKLAHVEDERAASPGTALTAMMIRRLIEVDGVRALDFGCGDDPYKRLWVGQRRQRIGVALVDPRHPQGLAELARHAAGRVLDRVRARVGGTADPGAGGAGGPPG